MSEFQGQTVVVTGAASGIGLGTAKAFYDAGARVVLGDFRPEALERVRGEFADTERVAFETVDVREPESVTSFVAAGETALGPASILVANAGIYPNRPLLDMPVEEWDRVMDTNLRGVFLTCQAVGRRMVANGVEGSMVTISSGAAFSGRRGATHYCSSKAGVVMFTKVLAMELAEHRIRVNCIAPGAVAVNSEVSFATEEYRDALLKSIPWGRSGVPADIAKAVLFLASANADFITGAVLSVDGGSSAGRAHLPYSMPIDR